MDSQSSTADICSHLEGKLDLQAFSGCIVGTQDFAPFETINNSIYNDLPRLDANNFNYHQSPQPHLEDANDLENNLQIIEGSLSGLGEGDHLLDSDVFEESISSSYNSSSNSNAQRDESSTREGRLVEVELKTNWARFHPHTIILSQFFAIGKDISPKKEYLRITTIRSHKKLLRYIEANKPLCKVIRDLNVKSPAVIEIIIKIKQHFDQYKNVFKEISKTESGPKTDGRCKKNKKEEHKSWNNKFVKEYFENPVVLESFLLHVELIFADCDINTLIQRVKAECCKNKIHTPECSAKWEIMKNFISEKIITDLGVSLPVNTNSQNILSGVEAIPERSQGFGSDNIDSYLGEQSGNA